MGSFQQGTMLATAVAALVGALVVIQLWLVGAALDGLLRGDGSAAVPAAIASAALFAANGGLLLYVRRFDAELRRGGRG